MKLIEIYKIIVYINKRVNKLIRVLERGEILSQKIRILVSTLLISTMLLSLVGCGDKKENDGSDKGNKSQTEQKSDDNKQEEKKSS